MNIAEGCAAMFGFGCLVIIAAMYFLLKFASLPDKESE